MFIEFLYSGIASMQVRGNFELFKGNNYLNHVSLNIAMLEKSCLNYYYRDLCIKKCGDVVNIATVAAV